MHYIFRSALAVALAACAVAPAANASDESKITLVNHSHWAIHQMYFAPSDSTEWGADQLGNHTINTGGNFTLSGIPCNKYDVKLVDEDGDECVVQDVAICADKESWKINDSDLLGCQSKTASE